MNVIPYPDLDGWEHDSQRIGELIFSHFLASNYSQTFIYQGNISSLAYLIQQYQNLPSELTTHLRTTLTNLFNRYFTSSNVEVRITDSISLPGSLDLHIFIEYTDSDGQPVRLVEAIQASNDTFKRIKSINNEGTSLLS